jgi:hypothetical protein
LRFTVTAELSAIWCPSQTRHLGCCAMLLPPMMSGPGTVHVGGGETKLHVAALETENSVLHRCNSIESVILYGSRTSVPGPSFERPLLAVTLSSVERTVTLALVAML